MQPDSVLCIFFMISILSDSVGQRCNSPLSTWLLVMGMTGYFVMIISVVGVACVMIGKADATGFEKKQQLHQVFLNV